LLVGDELIKLGRKWRRCLLVNQVGGSVLW